VKIVEDRNAKMTITLDNPLGKVS